MSQRQAGYAYNWIAWAAAVAVIGASAPTLAQRWDEITPTTGPAPSPRRNAAAVYDPIDHQLILFGGRSSSGDQGDLWRFDLSAHEWERLDVAAPGPVPRFTHNAVYDVQARRMVVWSGRKIDADGQELFSDVWAFDIEAAEWALLQPSTELPQRRYGTAAIYDPRSHALINFAGFTLEGRFDDTWRFDLASALWEQLDPSGNPGERCLHTAAYDRLRGRMIIFGGQRGADALGDVWALDLGTRTWEELDSTAGPGGRKFPASVYDPVRDRFLILGGDTGTEKAGGVWALNLAAATWEELRPAGEAPAARDGAVAVYVAPEQRLVLFGGTGDDHLADVWSLSLPAAATAVTDRASTDRANADRADARAPAASKLGQSYPNPFNATTVIPFRVAATSRASGHPVPVELAIYDVLGRRVRVLVQESLAPGHHEVSWHGDADGGRAVGSGIFICRMSTPDVRTTRKLLLVR